MNEGEGEKEGGEEEGGERRRGGRGGEGGEEERGGEVPFRVVGFCFLICLTYSNIFNNIAC